AGRVHHLRPDARAGARRRVGDLGRPLDDGVDQPGRLAAGDDPRRPRARDARQPRARLGLAGIGAARARALVRGLRRSLATPTKEVVPAWPARPSNARLRMQNDHDPQRDLASEPDYVAINREGWTQANAEYTDSRAAKAWQDDITWGKWSLPE